MAEVIPQINIDGTKIKDTWVQKEVVTNDVYNAINKAVINLKDNNNLLDTNSMLFREEYNSSSKDLNNAINQGVYSFTSSAVNAPSGVNGGNLLVTNTSKTEQGSSIITQFAFCHNNSIYIRTKNTTENFTNWKQLSFLDSPSFFGTPTTVTPPTDDNTQKIPNTSWVQAWVKFFVSQLSTNIEVETQPDGHFYCFALEITGLIAKNGYICLGKLFGNLIIQWGSINVDQEYTLPISFSSFCCGTCSFYTSILQIQATSLYLTNTKVRIVANYTQGTAQGFYLTIGK